MVSGKKFTIRMANRENLLYIWLLPWEGNRPVISFPEIMISVDGVSGQRHGVPLDLSKQEIDKVVILKEPNSTRSMGH